MTLPLPETSARVNLRDCFHELLKEEVTFYNSLSSSSSLFHLQRIDEFNCEQCKRSRPHSKKIDIVKLPPLLVLHLSRFYQEGLYTRWACFVFPTKTVKYVLNSYWSSSGRSPFRLTCTESFKHALSNYVLRSVDTTLCRKKQNFVNFDLQGVDMSRFALDGFDNKFSKFNLYAVST